MTPLEDTLRAALRETADEIPAAPPPLRLSARRRERFRPGGQGVRRSWVAWAAPLASAALVVAVIAGSLAVTGSGPHPPDATPRPATFAPVGPDGVPLYYVALTTRGSNPDEYSSAATAAEVRATATGVVLARIVVPKPYVNFTGVTAAADDRTFVLVAEEKKNPPASVPQYPHAYYPASRFYLLHIDPASAAPSGRASLRALPAAFIPANDEVHDMALSPDGNSLAADVGAQFFDSHLYVFNLATGAKRTWSYQPCSGCGSSSGGLGFGGVDTDALSWTADGQRIAFVGPGSGQGAVRLLDISEPGSNLLTNSRPIVGSPSGTGPYWRGALITPDGRAVIVVEEIAVDGDPVVRQRLVKFSAATGQATENLNDLRVVWGYEQVLWTNATGSVMVVAFARSSDSVGILHGGKYTPIPWFPRTATAAW
jgi:hypothetical protein